MYISINKMKLAKMRSLFCMQINRKHRIYFSNKYFNIFNKIIVEILNKSQQLYKQIYLSYEFLL
jgi:hypothetical protein